MAVGRYLLVGYLDPRIRIGRTFVQNSLRGAPFGESSVLTGNSGQIYKPSSHRSPHYLCTALFLCNNLYAAYVLNGRGALYSRGPMKVSNPLTCVYGDRIQTHTFTTTFRIILPGSP